MVEPEKQISSRTQFHRHAHNLATQCPFPEEATSVDPEIELYALSAVAIDRVISYAFSKRTNHPPLGLKTTRGKNARLKKSLSIDKNFQELELNFGKTLEWYTFFLSMYPDENTQDEFNIHSIRERLTTVLDLMPARKLHYENGFKLINAGIGTGVSEMTRVLKTIPLLYRQKHSRESTSVEDLMKTARNSYPIVVQLASMHLTRFLQYSQNLDAHLLRFNLKSVTDGNAVTLSVARSPTKGCPALVDFGEGSAIKRVWRWYLEIAKQIYSMYYPAQSSIIDS